MARIFLCHASEDKARVREVYQHLKALGFAPWLDEVDILPGQDWEYEIKFRGASAIHRVYRWRVCSPSPFPRPCA